MRLFLPESLKGAKNVRLAVFSDIHSNEPALRACLAYADHVGTDGYVFLGDHVSDCPDPERTLELMREAARRKKTWFLRGNREDYLLDYVRSGAGTWKPGNASGSLYYTLKRLSKEDLEFLGRMPLNLPLEFEGCPRIRACHATPTNNYVLLYPGAEALESILRTMDENTLLTGHSHFQYRYESRGRQAINPGAVGMPSHGQKGAQFAMVTCLGGRWSARLLNIEYDREALLKRFEESGLADMGGVYTRAVMRTFREGGNWQGELSLTARKLSQARGERAVSDQTWEDAGRMLGL